MKVEVYFDVVCPWCYIGERRFARALESGGADVEVVFRPFQLDPAAPAAPTPIAHYLTRRFGAAAASMQARVSSVAAGEGIVIDWERALMTNTLAAHRLVRLARAEHGSAVERAVVEALFAAHFTDGVDVGSVQALSELAAGVGMDGERVTRYLSSDEGEAEVRGEIEEARAIGVQSVPTFVFDEQFALEGAQPAATFVDVLEELRRRSAGAATS